MKLYYKILVLVLVVICNLSCQDSVKRTALSKTWQDTNAPFSISKGDEVLINSIKVDIENSFFDGNIIYAFNNSRNIWRYQNKQWSQINPEENLLPLSVDFVSFTLNKLGNQILALSDDNTLLFYDGKSWNNVHLDSCLKSNILDVAISRYGNMVTFLGEDGKICQYNSVNSKWTSTNIVLQPDSDVSLGNLNSQGLFCIDNSKGKIFKLNPIDNKLDDISLDVAGNNLDLGPIGLVVNDKGTSIVILNSQRNNFYYYDNGWHNTYLDLNSFKANTVSQYSLYYDDKGKPYIFALLDNSRIIFYYQGKWSDTQIELTKFGLDANLINTFTTNLSDKNSSTNSVSTNQMKLLIGGYSNTEGNFYMLYDAAKNSYTILNKNLNFDRLYFSSDLNYIYAITTTSQVYLYDIKSQGWINTQFDINKFNKAQGILDVYVSDDGIINMSLTNGFIITYR